MPVHRKLASGFFQISVLINIPEVPEWTTVHSPSWKKRAKRVCMTSPGSRTRTSRCGTLN